MVFQSSMVNFAGRIPQSGKITRIPNALQEGWQQDWHIDHQQYTVTETDENNPEQKPPDEPTLRPKPFQRELGGRKLYWLDEGEPSSLIRLWGDRRLRSVSFLTDRITVERSMPVIRAISA